MLLAGPALAAGAAEDKGPDPIAFAIVGAITLAVPVLFLAASAIRPSVRPEDEEIEPVVSGIPQGTAGVPRWLYVVYVLIPVWAMVYLFTGIQPSSNAASAPAPTREPRVTAVATPATAGPVRIGAKGIVFDTKQIALKADAPAQIVFRNDDAATPHNVAIYKDNTAKDVIFKGDLVTGPASKTYSFKAPAAGSYYFRCDVHPTTMEGTVVVA
jgi:plastocyanin